MSGEHKFCRISRLVVTRLFCALVILYVGDASHPPSRAAAAWYQRIEQWSRTTSMITATSVVLAGAHVANAESLKSTNTKLESYGLPPVTTVPSGFTSVVSEYGRGSIKNEISNPIVVRFAYPKSWVVQTTSVNENGEAGTISANDYFKGDSAFMYVTPTGTIAGAQNGASTAPNFASSDSLLRFVSKALSQKGDPADSITVQRVYAGRQDQAGQPYTLADFSYQLNTQAGFVIDRCGVVALTSAVAFSDSPTTAAAGARAPSPLERGSPDGGTVGKDQTTFLQGLVAVTTAKRWRGNNMEQVLRTVAESFRVYRLNSGVFSTN